MILSSVFPKALLLINERPNISSFPSDAKPEYPQAYKQCALTGTIDVQNVPGPCRESEERGIFRNPCRTMRSVRILRIQGTRKVTHPLQPFVQTMGLLSVLCIPACPERMEPFQNFVLVQPMVPYFGGIPLKVSFL